MATSQLMHCMEIWGGNQIVNTGVVMSGLDAWVYSEPYGHAEGGGDVYYVSACATGRITRLLVADVSGHGTTVCDLAGVLRGLMRQYVNQLDQTRFVRSMNEQFGTMARAGCFATAIVVTFFAPTNSISLCNAGHPPPLHYRAATGEWSYMDRAPADDPEPRNVPLGILDLTDYDQFDERLEVGDLVLCYTDSLVESGDGRGELLGQEGLLEIVRGLAPSDPATFIPRLLAAIASRAEGNLTQDDVTVLLFRPNGTAPKVPLREKVMAPVRLCRSLVDSLRPGGEPMPWPDFNLANLGGAMFSPFNRLWHGCRRGRTTTPVGRP